MKNLRKILFPFSILYCIVTGVRNWLYDTNFLKSTAFATPIIAVGNLSVGGTGKTPMTEYIVRLFSQKISTAILSRGYGRKTKGFVLATPQTTMQEIGDEPFQYATKFQHVKVAVCEDRVKGVNILKKIFPENKLIVLDDAYQHRKIKAGFYVLLSSYHDLFYNDWLLPMGNLRESISGIKRADVIVITKCPRDLSIELQDKIKKRISFAPERIFFSTIEYADFVTNGNENIKRKIFNSDFLAVTGIAKPEYFYQELGISFVDALTFSDHHQFSDNDIQNILKKANGKKILTTEKDFMRLKGKIPMKQLYYLPISIKFLDKEEDFVKMLEKNVEV